MDPVFAPSPVPPSQPAPLSANEPERQGPKPGRQPRLLFLIAGAAAVMLIAAGSYWWLHRHPAVPSGSAGTGQPVSQAPQPTPDTTTSSATTQYVSNGQDLNLSFMYPSNWTVTPPTDSNSGDQTITVTSPVVRMPDATGKGVTGRAVVSIRPGGAALTELAGGQATAGQASAQIAYDKPTSAQHQYPYLTYIHLAGGTDQNGAFEEAMVTGVTSFAKGQAILDTSLAQLDPIISARFYACASQACAAGNSASLSITNDTWLNDATCLQTLAIFKSLQIN